MADEHCESTVDLPESDFGTLATELAVEVDSRF